MGQNTGTSAALKSPSTAEPQQCQHKQEQEAAHWGATALLSFGGNSEGLVSPSLEHPAGHTATSLHLPAPAPPAALLCASQINTVAVTQQKELVPDNPSPSLSIYGSFHFVTLPQKVKKKRKSRSCDIPNLLWDLQHSPQWQSPPTDKHF